MAKASTLVTPEDPVAVAAPPRRFVSRGGDKLEAALDRFDVDVRGRDALDAGASTGGFTDCLLQRGASRVIAVDVGYGQLAWSLRQDPRVVVLERTNARDLAPERVPFAPEIVVADLSFISLRLVIPPLAEVSASGARFVLLVKPQFEAGRQAVGDRGVVSDPAAWTAALRGVIGAGEDNGLRALGVMASPLLGPAGNVEFLVAARRERPPSESGPSVSDATIDAAIRAALKLLGGHA